MPICYNQNCNRMDLPHAAGHDKRALQPCAHVRPNGEPCDPPGTYPFDVVEGMLENDAMWDLEGEPEATESEAEPERDAALGEKLSTTDQAVVDAALKAAIHPDREAPTPIPAIRATLLPEGEGPPQPKKPARRKAAKKSEAPPRAKEAESIDDWDP